MDRRNWITFALAATVTSSALAATTAPIAVQKTNSDRAKQAQLKNKKLISNQVPGESNLPVQATAVAPVKPTALAPVKTAAKPAPVAAQKLTPGSTASNPKPASTDQLRLRQSSASRIQLAAPTGTSTAAAPKAPPAEKPSDFVIGINNYYSGSAMVEPFAGYQPDPATGFDMGATELTTHLILGYKLNGNWTFSLNPMFATTPNYREYDAKTDSYTAKYGTTFKPVAPFLRLSAGSFVKTKTLNWNGDFRYYVPLTDDTRGEVDADSGKRLGLVHQLRTGQNVSFTLNEKLTFDVNTTVRFYGRPNGYQPKSEDSALNMFMFTANPGFNYTFNDTFGIGVSYWMRATHQYGRAITSLDNAGTYLEPSLTWNITKGLTLWPYLNLQTGKSVSAQTTQWGAELYWSIL